MAQQIFIICAFPGNQARKLLDMRRSRSLLNVANVVCDPHQQGETGTRTNASDLNLRFVDTITSAETCASMPNYQGAFWFNYIKRDIDHNLAVPGGSNLTTRFVEVRTGSCSTRSQHSASLTYFHIYLSAAHVDERRSLERPGL